MPRAPLRICTIPGCPNLTPKGRCEAHRVKAEQYRGNRHQRGYGYRHTTRFRPAVLRRDPLCTCRDTTHGHPAPCGAISAHADHYPTERRDLVRQGLDPDDPRYGRGLCQPCHSRHTATTRPGGWHGGQ